MTPFSGTNVVTSPRGYRTLNGVRSFHAGIDVTNPNGDWKVREVTGGTVTKIYTTSARGLVIEVTTDTGAIERYQHLLQALAMVGQRVKQGALIAVAGNSGECYGTPRADNEYMGGRHLHFEVLVGGKTSDNVSLWLGLPNKAGSYQGNDDLDGEGQEDQGESAGGSTWEAPAGAKKAVTITGPASVGYISKGDVAAIRNNAKLLGLPYTYASGTGLPDGAMKSITVSGPAEYGYISSGDVAALTKQAEGLGLLASVEEV